MDDNEFWIKSWLVALAVISILAITVMIETMHENYKIAELGKATSNPIAAYCAIHGITTVNSVVCNLQPQIKQQ